MSYDISITAIVTEQKEVFDVNYTYNVSPMLREAFGGDGINQFHKKKCSECLTVIELGVADMQTNPEKYKAMNPPNKWGDYDSLLPILEGMMETCRKNPDGIIRID